MSCSRIHRHINWKFIFSFRFSWPSHDYQFPALIILIRGRQLIHIHISDRRRHLLSRPRVLQLFGSFSWFWLRESSWVKWRLLIHISCSNKIHAHRILTLSYFCRLHRVSFKRWQKFSIMWIISIEDVIEVNVSSPLAGFQDRIFEKSDSLIAEFKSLLIFCNVSSLWFWSSLPRSCCMLRIITQSFLDSQLCLMHSRFSWDHIHNPSLIFMLLHYIVCDISSFKFVDRDLLRGSYSLSNAVISPCHLSIASSVLVTSPRPVLETPRLTLDPCWSLSCSLTPSILRLTFRMRLQVQLTDFHCLRDTWCGSPSRQWGMEERYRWSRVFLQILQCNTTTSTQAGSHTGRQPHRQAATQAGSHTGREPHRQAATQAGSHTGRQPHR